MSCWAVITHLEQRCVKRLVAQSLRFHPQLANGAFLREVTYLSGFYTIDLQTGYTHIRIICRECK